MCEAEPQSRGGESPQSQGLIRSFEADGVTIKYRQWIGDAEGTPLLLVHGGGANALWWSELLPELAALGFGPVAAVDLSGHGDSGWRTAYSIRGWAGELELLAGDLDLGSRAVLVGHSLGGIVALEAAAARPDRWAGIVALDSPVGRALRPNPDPLSERPRSAGYMDLATAVRRFRLMPEDHYLPPGVRELTAERSLIQGRDGIWRWKFDRRIFSRADRALSAEWGQIVDLTKGRTALVWAECSSVVGPDEVDEAIRCLGPERVLKIRGVHHHLILERPDLVASILSTVIRGWE
jgi:pimeloyl-ACP methyl ester carboxylesterase